MLALNVTNIFNGNKKNEKILKIVIPEMLNYTEVFNDIFDKYTTNIEKIAVKSVNMGSMFKLTYRVVLKDTKEEKAFIDELRCRNGNLEISIGEAEGGEVL